MDRLFHPFPTLETRRAVLREPLPADADALLGVYSDPEVVRYFDQPALERREQARKLLEAWARDQEARRAVRWLVTVGGEVVGTASLHGVQETHRFAELGYLLRRDQWGRGLATELAARVVDFALGTAGLHRVEALVDPRNAPSMRLLEKLGFRREGLLRQRFWKGGEALDDVMYSRLAIDPAPGAPLR